MDPFLGLITLFGGNFAPRGWAFCNGQLLPIAQNQSLYSILGTTYGGDGRTTFALPDLRGRMLIHEGQGPGLSNYPLGSKGGAETTTLTVNTMPSHTHAGTIRVGGDVNLTNVATGNLIATDARGGGTPPQAFTSDPVSGSMALNSVAIDNTGGGQPFPSRSPYAVCNYIIALQGTFPARN